jgi:RHS repeat-associated protein
MKYISLYALRGVLAPMTAFIAVIGLTATTQAAQPNMPPLPAIKTQAELREWTAKKIAEGKAKEATQAAQTNLQPIASQIIATGNSLFFTGKPYIAELESYAFRFRTYDPELHRWTTEDPSGFPDGPNGSAYAPVPTFALDWQGLEQQTYYRYYGWRYSTVTYVNTDVSREISLTGFSIGASAAGFSGSISFGINTSATVVSDISSVKLEDEKEDAAPQGDGCVLVQRQLEKAD